MIPVDIFIGQVAALPCGRPSAMAKVRVETPIDIGPEGLAGDQQADRRVHGGPDKALHLYPAAHLARLAARFPDTRLPFVPGALGENLSTPHLDEADVRLGDIFGLGTARLQICQPRTPCWKIDDRFGVEGIAAHIAETHMTGWYWRVLTPGRVAPGDGLVALDSTPGALTLAAAQALCDTLRPPLEALRQLAATPGIAPQWQHKLLQRIDWLARQAPPARST